MHSNDRSPSTFIPSAAQQFDWSRLPQAEARWRTARLCRIEGGDNEFDGGTVRRTRSPFR